MNPRRLFQRRPKVASEVVPEAAPACPIPALDPARIPRHIAIIMDGNGRWARAQGWQRVRGHRKGAEVVRSTTTVCAELGVERLTLYAFSTENWDRPATEVAALMQLLKQFLRDELPTLMANQIRLTAIGQLHRLPAAVRRTLQDTADATAKNTALDLCLALSYGGRDEIADATQAIAQAVQAGTLDPARITAKTVQKYLYAPDAPDVDLVIRTAGEQRLSNFLPWQTVYAEYVSVAACWPDFTPEELHAALRTYQARDRRFGKVT